MNIIIDAYLDNNLGDDLMIKLLAGHFPRHRFFLYSNLSVVENTFRCVDNVVVKKLEERAVDLETADAYITIGGSLFQLATPRQKYCRLKKLIRLRKIHRKQTKINPLGSNYGH